MNTFRKGLFLGASVAALTLGAAHSASAAEANNDYSAHRSWYVSLFGGISLPESMDSSTTYTATTGAVTPGYIYNIDMDSGFIIGSAIGTELWDNVRGEIEFAFRSSDSGTINFSHPGLALNPFSSTGDVTSVTILANLWYDFESISDSRSIRPYIGGGIGIGFIDANIRYVIFPGFGFIDNDTAFAFQVGTGINWELSDRTSLGVGYRLKGLSGVDFVNPLVPGAPGLVQSNDLDVILSHNFIVNLTWTLN